MFKMKTEDEVYAKANLQASRKGRYESDDTYLETLYESVDTPLVERRKNWFQRQISRMGSVRSASTEYSSGGLFGRNRHNSVVYLAPAPHKISSYERLVGGQKTNGTAESCTNDQGGQEPREPKFHIKDTQNLGVLVANQGYENEVPVLGALDEE